MSYLEFPLSDFSFLSTLEQGLKELQTVEEKNYFKNQINEFKLMVPDQPVFFISRKSWSNLFNGISYNNDGTLNNWINAPKYIGFEICAFLICIGFHKGEFEQKDPYFGYNPLTETKKNKKAYFRIRTILKNERLPLPMVRIEIENIAYGDLEVSLRSDTVDCLKFITKKDCIIDPKVKKLKTKIDEGIYKNLKGHPRIPEDISHVPTGFLVPNPNPAMSGSTINITNNGNYFGSRRIWTDLLLTMYPASLGSKISFMWDKSNNSIGQYFKINDDCVTKQPCPGPPGC